MPGGRSAAADGLVAWRTRLPHRPPGSGPPRVVARAAHDKPTPLSFVLHKSVIPRGNGCASTAFRRVTGVVGRKWRLWVLGRSRRGCAR
jgi:hypothetical protein